MHHEMKVVPTRLVFGRGCCALGALVLVAATAGGAPGRRVVGPGFSPEETAARAKETHERRSRSVRRQFRSHRSRIARPRPRGESARLSRGRAGLLFGKRTASKLSLTEEERTRLREASRDPPRAAGEPKSDRRGPTFVAPGVSRSRTTRPGHPRTRRKPRPGSGHCPPAPTSRPGAHLRHPDRGPPRATCRTANGATGAPAKQESSGKSAASLNAARGLDARIATPAAVRGSTGRPL